MLAACFIANSSAAIIQKPFLFSVRGKGKTSFIFGSRHSKIALTEFPPYLLAALRSRPAVAKEILWDEHVTNAHDGEADQKIYPSLRATKALSARGIPSYLYNSPFICTYYYTWERGDLETLDKSIEDYSRRHKKVLTALDTVEDLERSDKRSDEINNSCDIEKVTASLSPTRAKKFDRDFLQQYKSGNLDKVTTCDGDSFCVERTLKWLPKFEHLHRQGVFVVVGVAHLVGANGLLQQLKNRGYRVERITSQSHLDTSLVN